MFKRRRIGTHAALPRVSLVRLAAGSEASSAGLQVAARNADRASAVPVPQLQRDCGPLVVPRNDAPLVKPYTRGSMDKALEAAATAESREEVVREFREREFAATSAGPRASNLRTWITLHQGFFGPDIPPFPLTPDKIKSVGALLCRGGYRSSENFFSRVKDRHLELGHDWNPLLAHAQTGANRAARRGRGPSHQCAELPIEEAFVIASGSEFADHMYAGDAPGAPANFQNYLVVASFFLLREIEASLMVARSVTFDTKKRVVTIFLPVSKTDPTALSCTRSWGCTCADVMVGLCPYHAAWNQKEWLREQFADEQGALPEGLPFSRHWQVLGCTRRMWSSALSGLLSGQAFRCCWRTVGSPMVRMCSGFQVPGIWSDMAWT